MKKYLFLLLWCCACAAFASTDEIVDRGTWFAITKGKTIVFFYDPYQTKQDDQGFVESVSYGRHMLDGSIIQPTFLNIDCANNSLRTFIPVEGGGRKQVKDWHTPREDSVGNEWIKSLCGYKTEDGTRIAFIGLFENPYNASRATHIFWLPEVERSPAIPGGKTYQLVYYVENDARGYDGYLYLDCKNDGYATSSDLGLDLDLLYWEKNPPLESVAGYLMTKACGPASDSRIRSQ